MSFALGCDPDSKDLSLATWGPDGPIEAAVVHVVGTSTNYQMLAQLAGTDLLGTFGTPATVVIEAQQIDRRRARPRDLFKLAHVTGAFGLLVRQTYPDVPISFPTPSEWKGNVAKYAMQARLYKELGWGFDIIGTGAGRYARPINIPARFNHIPKGAWKHIGDALLLAKFGYNSL